MERKRDGVDGGRPDRRTFLGALAWGAGTALLARGGAWGAPARRRKIKLGLDNFSIRAFGWKAPRLIEYARTVGVDTLLLSDLGVFESLDEPYLREVAAKARDAGIELHVGTGSICPTSSSYDAAKLGPAEEHLALLLRVARAVGSPVARCYLGTRRDRESDGGIERHIEETVRVCRALRSRALDDNVKIAIENHAGDMQAWELAGLIREAGPEYVGATMDSGNATWTMEDPLVNLEILGRHAVTTGMRDTALWETEKGATALWANMGRGVVDWEAYLDRYEQLCPKTPFVLEILSYTWPHELAYLAPETWKHFPKARASELARFVALARRGREAEIPEGRPRGERSRELEQAQQRYDLEESLRYCRETLGLGLRA